MKPYSFSPETAVQEPETDTTIWKAVLSFPELRLRVRDGHKLRGYLASTFGHRSDLFHNHEEDGSAIFRYPLIQYKVLKGIPTIIALQQGAFVLREVFMQLKELSIDECKLLITEKSWLLDKEPLEVSEQLYIYEFETFWMGLNQENARAYRKMTSASERRALLDTVLRNNLLTVFKGLSVRAHNRIMVSTELKEQETNFKDQRMYAFSGRFTTNVLLPDGIGIGKSAARGFGTVKRIR